MLTIHTILHPTDFTPQSAGAFHLACALARDHRAHLIILHVATHPPMILSDTGLQPPMDDCKQGLMERLETMDLNDDGVHLTRRLEEGEPAEEILRVALLCGADLIVMGTHGRRGLSRLLMGSVAERVVRAAPCPVLTLRTPFAPAEAETAGLVLEAVG